MTKEKTQKSGEKGLTNALVASLMIIVMGLSLLLALNITWAIVDLAQRQADQYLMRSYLQP